MTKFQINLEFLSFGFWNLFDIWHWDFDILYYVRHPRLRYYV